MKKNSVIICISVFILSVSLSKSFAQETARERITRRQNKQTKTQKTLDLTVRAQQKNASQRKDMRNARWMREIYRYLDLSKDKNAPLYYPVMPEDGRMNLFTMIFRLLSTNSIKAYEYLDGRELFTDEYRIDFKELMDRYSVYYEETNEGFVINESDVPSNEVQGYYIKELWYFNADNSTYDVKTTAICPVILRQDDFGAETTKYPMFWVPYDEIRLYAMRMPMMTSNLNNAMLSTVDDFFRKHDYDGEIYKTTNMRNLAIAQYASTPELMKKEQGKIEKQLSDFKKNLWTENSIIPKQKKKEEKKEEIEGESITDKKNNSRPTRGDIKSKKSSSKSDKKSSAPKRSMRNRR